MRLRLRMLLVVGTGLAVLLGVLTLGVRTAWLAERRGVEERMARRDHRQALHEVDELAAGLATSVADWGIWDDTYLFARGENPQFLRRELDNPEVYRRLQVDLVALFAPDGTPIVARTVGAGGRAVHALSPLVVPEAHREALAERALAAPGPAAGVTAGGGHLLLLAAHQIVPRSGVGPPAGVLVFGRYVDDSLLAETSSDEALLVTLHLLGDPALVPDVRAAMAELAEGRPLHVARLDDDAIAAYSVIRDLSGEPVAVLRSRGPRTLFMDAVAMSRGAVIAGLLVGALVAALGLLLLDRCVLRRLSRLDADLAAIRAARDPLARVHVDDGDELGAVQRGINDLLDALHQAETERRESGHHLRRHEAITFAAERILSLHTWEEGAPVILARLGEATLAARAFLIEAAGGIEAEPRGFVRYAWSRPDAGEAAPLPDRDARTLLLPLMRGTPVELTWDHAGAVEQRLLEDRRAGAVLLVPVFVEGRFWGAICCEDLPRARTWSAEDRAALTAAASMIGAAVAAEAARRELLAAKHQAEAAARTKGDFLATMSHEIRTPLNAVIGLSELALDTQDPQERVNYLRIVRSSAHSLLALLNDILDFSRIEAGRLEIESIDFDVRRWADEVVGSFAQQAAQKGLTLRCEVSPDVPALVKGDPGRLRQITVNLLGNALKFTPRGRVDLRIGVAEHGASGTALQIDVQDTGIGIPREKLDAVWDAFTQADATTTRRFGGSGLGLAICRRLVRLLGGRIWVESEPGVGSTFSFTAWMRPSTAEEEHDSGPVPSRRGSLRVLVAEDNDVNQLLARRLLERNGHVVTCVGNGRAAVEECRQRTYDLILMDLQMPELDGLDATAQIRADQRASGSHVPIVAMTANALPGDRERCLAAGMDGYVAKPIKVKELFETIERVLGTLAPNA